MKAKTKLITDLKAKVKEQKKQIANAEKHLKGEIEYVGELQDILVEIERLLRPLKLDLSTKRK